MEKEWHNLHNKEMLCDHVNMVNGLHLYSILSKALYNIA